jgi:glucose-1-phosphate thymidylyltransferase
MAKQLIPIANKPVLQYVIENIRKIGVTDVGVIVGDRAEEIAGTIGDGSRFGVRVTYIRQDEPLGLAHCVALARPFLGDDDFVMYLGDNMLPDGIANAAVQFALTRPAAQVIVHKVPDPRPFGVVEVDAGGVVLGLAEKPVVPRSDLAIVGVYFFTKEIHRAVDSIEYSARGELEITDAIRWLLDNGARITAYPYRGYWKDTGNPQDVLDCNRRVLSELQPRIAGDVDTASELYGPVVVEPGARIRRSTIIGPVVVGAGTVIEDSSVGPDTSIGRECVLRGAELADSIVLDDASILEVPDLRSCIIGRSADVGAGSRQEAHHVLVIGDHARIKLAVRPLGLAPVPQVLAKRAS